MMSRSAPRAAAGYRRLFGPLLLSLALLLSQQAVLTHALSHVQRASRAAAGGAKQSGSSAKDGSCADCLAHAQFFSALGSTHRAPAVSTQALLRLAMPATPELCLATVCMFQPRAPPQA